MARKETSQSKADNSNAQKPRGAARREQESPRRLSAGLYPVATPIGNLRDITLRALDVLETADLIACEDSRVTRKLLMRYSITTKTIVYNDHNAPRVLPHLIKLLSDGNSLALVSDAGTPLISDPGFKLVEAAISENIPVYPIPGANAAIAGLVASGLPTDSFFFAGFLPPKQGARRTRLKELARVPGSLIFYESSGRLAASLSDMSDILGPRKAVIAREITKLHEETIRDTLAHLVEIFKEHGGPRGEIVIVVGQSEAEIVSDETLEKAIQDALQTMSVRDAANEVAQQTGRAKRDIYARALEISGEHS